MARIAISSLFIGILVAGGWALRHQFWSGSASDTEPGQSAEATESECPPSINALGYLLPRDGILSVSAAPGDRLAILTVKEGQEVPQGAPLAELASRALKRLEWKARESQRKEAENLLAAEKAAAEKRIALARLAQEKIALQKIEEAAQEAQVAFLESNLRLVTKNLERLKDVRQSLVSTPRIEQQELLVEKTDAELQAAKLTLARMKSSREFAERSAQAELEVAETGLLQVNASDQTDSLKLAEKLAKLQFHQTKIKAPISGTILKTFLQPGESLGAGPILQMADLNHMVCQAEVFETDIQCVRIGQKVRVKSRAFPDPYDETGLEGTVRQVSGLVAAPKLQSLDPYAPTDRHVMEVEIEFGPQASQVAGGFVNLQVQVEFLNNAESASDAEDKNPE